MSNFVTTNIRIPEEDYLRLKQEAARERKSLSAVIREKVVTQSESHSGEEVDRIMVNIEKIAKKNAKYTKGFDSVKALREIRYQEK